MLVKILLFPLQSNDTQSFLLFPGKTKWRQVLTEFKEQKNKIDKVSKVTSEKQYFHVLFCFFFSYVYESLAQIKLTEMWPTNDQVQTGHAPYEKHL